MEDDVNDKTPIPSPSSSSSDSDGDNNNRKSFRVNSEDEEEARKGSYTGISPEVITPKPGDAGEQGQSGSSSSSSDDDIVILEHKVSSKEQQLKLALKEGERLEEKREDLIYILVDTNVKLVEQQAQIQNLERRVKQLQEVERKKKLENAGLYVGAAAVETNPNVKCAELIFTEEIWKLILDYLTDYKDLQNCNETCLLFQKILAPTGALWLFDKVFPHLQRHLDQTMILNCRLVSKNWNAGVDEFYENHPTLRPHNELKADPKAPPFEIPKLGQYIFTNRDQSLRTSGFQNEFGSRPRNPFIGRSLHLVEYEFPGPGAIPSVQFWKEVYDFLALFGEHIWTFTFSKLGCHQWMRMDNSVGPFLTRDVFMLLPNLRKLAVGGNMNWDGHDMDLVLTPAPHLEILQLDDCSYGYPHPLLHYLSKSYPAQLGRLHVKKDTWRLVSSLDWPKLVELHIEDLGGDDDLRSLIHLNVPQLRKLGVSFLEDHLTTRSFHILLAVVNKLCSISKLTTLRMDGGFPQKCITCLPTGLWAHPALKTLEVENNAEVKERMSYNFLLRFPFLRNLNVFWRAKQEAPLRGRIEIKFRTESDFRPEAKDEIVNLHNTMYDKKVYQDSTIFDLLPQLEVFTFQDTIYTKQGYLKHIGMGMD